MLDPRFLGEARKTLPLLFLAFDACFPCVLDRVYAPLALEGGAQRRLVIQVRLYELGPQDSELFGLR